MEFKTEIRKTLNGNYQVGFTIGVQTFYLQENEEDTLEESKQVAEWFEKNLKNALAKLS